MARRSTNYPRELRERAVRMVAQVRPKYPSGWPAICAVAEKLGIGTAETLRMWVRQAEVDAGQRAGVTNEESAEIRRPKRRTPSCAGQLVRSSRRRRLSSRRSSTAHGHTREVHRR